MIVCAAHRGHAAGPARPPPHVLMSCWSALPVLIAAAHPDRRRPAQRGPVLGHAGRPHGHALVALVFGTAALGSEIEDGTAVYL